MDTRYQRQYATYAANLTQPHNTKVGKGRFVWMGPRYAPG